MNHSHTAASFASDRLQEDSATYTLRRMLLGVPEGPAEIIPGSALPMESCMDVMGGSQSIPLSL